MKSCILKDMITQTLTCKRCSKQFLVIEKEQKFLKDKDLPLPANCPSCRQLRRLQMRGERTLYKTTCQKCGKDIVVSYDPKKIEQTILCRKDYDQYFEENDAIISDPLPEA